MERYAGDGEVAVPLGQLAEYRDGGRLLNGDKGLDQQLVRSARRLVQPLEVVRRCHLAPSGGAVQHQGGAERQHAGRHLGRRVGERDAAAERAAVADRHMRDVRHGLGDQRQVARDGRGAGHVHMAGQRPDAHLLAAQLDAGQGLQPVDVDQQARAGTGAC